jgi:hypothetical protein
MSVDFQWPWYDIADLEDIYVGNILYNITQTDDLIIIWHPNSNNPTGSFVAYSVMDRRLINCVIEQTRKRPKKETIIDVVEHSEFFKQYHNKESYFLQMERAIRDYSYDQEEIDVYMSNLKIIKRQVALKGLLE